MNIVYIASEIAPYASTGGLADVADALPRMLSRLGATVTRIMPMYRQVIEGPFKLHDMGIRLNISVGFHSYRAEVWSSDEHGPTTYFIRRDEFFDRSQLYSLADRDYDDNFERFVFFQKAAVALIDTLNLKPDIVHCNDWQTGLISTFLEYGIHGIRRDGKERVVFTIHNLAYQGIFPGNDFSLTNLPFFCFSIDMMEYYGNINCMKAGITSADRVTTVSKTYAREILTEENGCGLQGVLNKVQDKLMGIVNGVDYQSWNPSSDPYLVARYSAQQFGGKLECKKDLLKRMGLNVPVETPVLGMVTRLVDQKGLDLLEEAMPSIMNLDVVFVLLGSGQDKYHELCETWKIRWPNKFACKLAYDKELSHKIEAGSDIYLMPSKFEPCGLNQLYSMRYGALPIVHAVGGLDDTVEEVNEAGTQGNGFKFKEYTASAFMKSLQKALTIYRTKPEVWKKIRERAMMHTLSWDAPAREYLEVYNKLLTETSP